MWLLFLRNYGGVANEQRDSLMRKISVHDAEKQLCRLVRREHDGRTSPTHSEAQSDYRQ